MSETPRHHNYESNEPKEHDPYKTSERQEAARRHLEKAAAEASSNSHEDIKRIEQDIERKAESSKDILDNLARHKQDRDKHLAYGDSSADALPRAIIQARKQLKPVDRAISKIIHKPAVENVSAVAGATLARPSGMLYGAIFSFLAVFGFYFVSRKYGYDYNAFIGILAFVGGFFMGLFIEILTRAIRPQNP